MKNYTRDEIIFMIALLLFVNILIYHVLPVWQLLLLFNLLFVGSLLLGVDKLIEKYFEEEEEENV